MAWHFGRVSLSHACAGMWQVGYSLACVCKLLWTDSLPSLKAATQPSCNGLSIQSMGPWLPLTTLPPICACTQLVTCPCLCMVVPHQQLVACNVQPCCTFRALPCSIGAQHCQAIHVKYRCARAKLERKGTLMHASVKMRSVGMAMNE